MTNRYIDVVGSQMDLGACRKGVDMGPLAIRHAGLIDRLKRSGFVPHDRGDVIVDLADDYVNEKLRYEAPINAANEKLFLKVRESLACGHFPVVLGGDHSIAAGSASAVAEYCGDIGIIWIDAHGDFNDETITLSGNLHGMPLSAVCGLGPASMTCFTKAKVDPGKVVIVGARDLDPLEAEKLVKSGVTVFSISDVHTLGMENVMERAVGIAGSGSGIHLSFDMDALDPEEAPGVGTPVYNGLTLREAYIALEAVNRSGKLLAMDLVEVNPLLDIRNKTGILATDLILTALGSTNY